ncbi:hypothetical protein RMN57_13105 [Kitasatospora sp. CM 4170]|uniref:Integral membrane protein n=1 Tax=Kitasatospora aburaviensis TaxID=67265 RepID=A0ABW1F5N7_9ACTN|nr:hypothetical protein [Kitasatospora sp. CM 4170]WNM45592.1 hypothetical protein RMN57_13105 [Kitasatospora sp. CM 4170]
MPKAGVIIVPQPAHHGPSSNVPTGYVVGYIAIALIVWAVATYLLARHDRDTDAFLAVMGGALAAVCWPLTFLAVPFWLIARAAARKPKHR